MPDESQAPSSRRQELLELAYAYVLSHGLAEVSLRPLASAIGSSPRVLLFLFGSKDGLTRALLARARRDELDLINDLRVRTDASMSDVAERVWQWLADPAHRPLLTLWLEAYSRSLIAPHGPWADFAHQTVHDWLTVLADAQTAVQRRSRTGTAERTLALAILRGALLDLLATGDVERTTAAVHLQLRHRRRK